MFTPNENSRASLLLGYVREHMEEAGDTVTYEEVAGILGLEECDDPGSAFSSIITVVNKRLHRDGDWRHLVNVAKLGYRVGTPNDVRQETLSRQRWVERQQASALRATEKIVRHPDATPGERQRAANAAASQAALLQMVRREHRKIRKAWPAEEESPVLDEVIL